ncbi:MAG: SDR family NAD(P)-dependent oxidoreductase, partial [Myxococcales bacterium]|nr:SDR family NAD(P)-dependent oxidoreductase [Myxococcales bacterium]
SGIGRALAVEFARNGLRVVVAARRKDALDELVTAIRSEGGDAHALELDVANVTAVAPAMEAVDDEFGGIDVVVANAGVGLETWGGKLAWQRCSNTIAVNIAGATATLVALLPRMVERKRGQLVGVSSLAQYRGLPRNAVYSASKAYLSTFLESVRVDLRGTGVSVTDVRPGFVRTPMTSKNKHTMPFLLDADEAARIVWRGVQARQSVVAFPWQLASVVRTVSVLPNSIYDLAITRARSG